jgi:hypothetical protein
LFEGFGGVAEATGFFEEEVFVVGAEAVAKFGVDRAVPLVEPGEQFEEAGEEGDESRVFAAADRFLDVDVVGGDGLGELEVVVSGPGDRQFAVVGFGVGEANPAFFGDVEFAA